MWDYPRIVKQPNFAPHARVYLFGPGYKIALILLLICAGQAIGYVELMRYGYQSCTACHVSPSGGGVLTRAGRASTEQVLSTWARDEEGRFLYGAVSPPSWLDIGGDISLLSAHQTSQGTSRNRWLLMQADVETAVTISKAYAAAVIGATPFFLDTSRFELASRRHYVGYRISELVRLRAGKFIPAYGLYLADHFAQIRGGLSWDYGREPYGIEVSGETDRMEWFATYLLGELSSPQNDRERGIALRWEPRLWELQSLGISYAYLSNQNLTRHLFGPFALIALSPDLFAVAEAAFHRASNQGMEGATWGATTYFRVNYMLIQGLQIYLSNELSRRDFSNPSTSFTGYGLGAQFFPRPHFEVQGFWQKRRSIADTSFSDYAWLLFHVYL